MGHGGGFLLNNSVRDFFGLGEVSDHIKEFRDVFRVFVENGLMG
jgi:hypothetical protein